MRGLLLVGLTVPLAVTLLGCGGDSEVVTVTAPAGQTTTEATEPAETENEAPPTEATETTPPEKTDPGDESVEAFALRLIETQERGQWGRAYQDLHPAQQKLMSPEQFADCMDESAGSLTPGAETRVADMYDEEWTIPGTKVAAPSKAVTIERVFVYEEEGSTVESPAESSTIHLFDTEDGWKWIVSEDVVDELRDDFC